MTLRIYKILLFLPILFTSCIKDKINSISDSVLINSSYSLPIGTAIYQVNDYFEALDTIHIPWPDSVSYNDTIYPNILDTITKTDDRYFDFTNLITNQEKIKSITFRVLVENSYPTEIRTQIYFTNQFMQTDSLFSNGFESFQPALVDQNGIVTAPSVQLKDIHISEEMKNNLIHYTNIQIYGQVLTIRPNDKMVKFYSNYKLKIHIGIRIEIEYNLNEL